MSVLDGLALLAVGSLWGRYALRCGAWLRYRRWIIYPTVPLWWALYFVLVTSWHPPHHILIMGLTHHTLLSLILPSPKQLDLQDPYAYLDAYEQFRQSRRLIFGAHLLAFGACGVLTWSMEGLLPSYASYIGQGLLVGLAGLTDHKGYTLLLAWLTLGIWMGM